MTVEAAISQGDQSVKRVELGVVGQRPQDLAPTLTHWIAQDPHRAVEYAREVLPLYRFQTFQMYVLGTMENGMTSSQIATALGKKRQTYLDEVKSAREAVHDSMGKPFERVTGNRLLDFFKENQAHKLFDKAQGGEVRSTTSLLGLVQKEIDKHARRLPEKARTEYLLYTAIKVYNRIPEVEWRGLASLTQWLRTAAHNCFLDEARRLSINLSSGENTPIHNSHPKDLIDQWYLRHPQRVRAILQGATEMTRDAYLLSLTDVPHKRIAEIIGSANEDSVKVLIYNGRKLIAEKSGIHIPRTYRNITEFGLTKQEAQVLRNYIRLGKVKGALYLNAKYYITDQMLENYRRQRNI